MDKAVLIERESNMMYIHISLPKCDVGFVCVLQSLSLWYGIACVSPFGYYFKGAFVSSVNLTVGGLK